MFSYIGESPNAVEGQSYKVIVRGDHGREVYKWSSIDDYQTGVLSLSPLPVLTHPRVTQLTRSTIINSKWNVGTLVLKKRQLTNVPAGEAGVVRKMHLEIQAQPAYQITGFNLEGIPTLFQTTKIVTGTADRYKVPITLIREDSAVPFIPEYLLQHAQPGEGGPHHGNRQRGNGRCESPKTTLYGHFNNVGTRLLSGS